MVKLIRLITGDEIVADIVENDLTYSLNKPIKVVLMPDGSAGMMPFLALSKEDKVTIVKSNVLYAVEPDDELANIYNSRFGSGIVVPPSGLDLGGLDLGNN